MHNREIFVVALADGKTEKAILMLCDDCGSDVFHIFVIEGMAHPHVQCGRCGVSYCPDGNCAKGEEVQVTL